MKEKIKEATMPKRRPRRKKGIYSRPKKLKKQKSNMRHLVVCGDSKVKAPLESSVLPPRPRRTGQDHTVLLTVVGNSASAAQNLTDDSVQNPDLIPAAATPIPAISTGNPLILPPVTSHIHGFPVHQPCPSILPVYGAPAWDRPPPSLPEVTHRPIPASSCVHPDAEVTHRLVSAIHTHKLTSVSEAGFKHTTHHSEIVKTEIPVIDNFMANEMPDEQTSQMQPAVFIDDGGPMTFNRVSWLPGGVLRKVGTSGDYWHKFTVHRGAGYTKLEIMHALFDVVQPQMIAPVMYRREGNSVSFLARNCLAALLRLTQTNMQIQVNSCGPLGPSVQALDVEVTLRHTSIHDLRLHLHDHLVDCIGRRHDKALKALDLSGFHQDPELSEIVYWGLWVPKAFVYILNMLKTRIGAIRCLYLADNELTDLPKCSMLAKVQVVDLSSNKISSLNILKAFSGMRILEVTLDRNPVCAQFSDERSYIEAIKEMLPMIKKIDGVYLTRPELPVWRRHYVPPGQTECIALVDQFLQHYFTLLDGDDRQRLRGMYHPDALFSLTCNYVPGQSTSSTARLTRYTLESRNLLRLSDYSKSQQLLSQGAEEVLSALCRLPRTEHDPYSFAVDLPYYTQDTALIVVSGVFREPSMMNENLVRAFSRTFVLRKVASKEYQIVNEMLTVSNASTKQAEESFQYPKPKVSLAKLSFNPAQDLTDADRKQMTRILSRLTEMNQQWAEKCLEQSKWDIKWALVVFTELLKMNKLPGEAFELEEDRVGEKK